jgi:hypothetical protein
MFAFIFEINNELDEYEIEDSDEDVVRNFLSTLYFGENSNNGNAAIQVGFLAARFNVEPKEIYELNVLANMNESNALDVLKLGNEYKSEKLIESAFGEIKKFYPEGVKCAKLKRKPDQVQEIVDVIKKFKSIVEKYNCELIATSLDCYRILKIVIYTETQVLVCSQEPEDHHN